MPWYAIQHKPSQGNRALANLQNQDIQCFHPKVAVERVIGGKRTPRIEPLFPGYIFINVKPGNPVWRKLRSTRGILRVLSFGEKPGVIPDEVINYIADTLETARSVGGLRKGEPVRIQAEPFKGLEAIFHSYDGEERAIVLISFMQSQRSG